MDDSQLQALLNNGQAVANRLAADCRYVDAAIMVGLMHAVRALRTRIEPEEAKPALVAVE